MPQWKMHIVQGLCHHSLLYVMESVEESPGECELYQYTCLQGGSMEAMVSNSLLAFSVTSPTNWTAFLSACS